MLAKEVPGITYVFFSLLEGDLFSDAVGLISHICLRGLMGI